MDQTYYNRLAAVARLPYDQDPDEQGMLYNISVDVEDALKQIQLFIERLEAGLRGEAGKAAQSLAKKVEHNTKVIRTQIVGFSDKAGPMWKSKQVARDAMLRAKQDFESLSPILLSPSYMASLRKQDKIWISVLEWVLPDVYIARLKEQSNARREKEARAILERMNRACQNAVYSIPPFTLTPIDWPPQIPWPPNSWPEESESQDSYGTGGLPDTTSVPSVSSIPSFSNLPNPPGGSVPPIIPGLPGPGPDPSLPYPGNPVPPGDGVPAVPGIPGNYQDSPWDRVDLTNTPVFYPNGPSNGIVPPSVLNANDPGWRTDYTSAQFTGGGPGSWGATGMGAALGMGAGMAAGAGLSGGSWQNGIWVPDNAAGAGAGGVGAAGAGKAGSSSMMPGAGGGSGKDGKIKRRKYQVLKITEDEEEATQALHPAMGAGSVDDIEPMVLPEEDYWN